MFCSQIWAALTLSTFLFNISWAPGPAVGSTKRYQVSISSIARGEAYNRWAGPEVRPEMICPNGTISPYELVGILRRL